MQFSWKNIAPNDDRSGALKIGGWHHFGLFSDQRFTADGRSIADPAGSGLGRMLQADDGIYSVIEQKIYAVPKSKDRGVGVFMRTSASPSDRNLIATRTSPNARRHSTGISRSLWDNPTGRSDHPKHCSRRRICTRSRPAGICCRTTNTFSGRAATLPIRRGQPRACVSRTRRCSVFEVS
jgi:hypothetical protein